MKMNYLIHWNLYVCIKVSRDILNMVLWNHEFIVYQRAIYIRIRAW